MWLKAMQIAIFTIFIIDLTHLNLYIMRVHFIAIGGAAMHNLAIALHKKGFQVSGSDDEIFEPSKSRLDAHGLLPIKEGWNADIITSELDAIILGMHARADNPELVKALELGIKVFSYPEYLYEATKDKKRVVIGGSHGKTTITSMIMHVLNHLKMDFDYMVGAQIEGFDTMVRLTNEAPIAIFEGDEYLTSPIDLRPKFHLYKPHIALVSGIAWDHINVFPTWENYIEQFSIFASMVDLNGAFIYFGDDEELVKIAHNLPKSVQNIAYQGVDSKIVGDKTILILSDKSEVEVPIFGQHNMQNLDGARLVCNQLGISDGLFFDSIKTFKGAAKRLQVLQKSDDATIFLDFAHSPSKLKATTRAVKEQFPNRELVACMELHTFSSLKREFLSHYKDSMAAADRAFVYFNPEVIKHKKLESITAEEVKEAFGGTNVTVFTSSIELMQVLRGEKWWRRNLLLMTSGNFDGMDFKNFSKDLIVGLSCM